MFRLQGTRLSRALALSLSLSHTHTHTRIYVYTYEYILCFAVFSVVHENPIFNQYILKRTSLKEMTGLNLSNAK